MGGGVGGGANVEVEYCFVTHTRRATQAAGDVGGGRGFIFGKKQKSRTTNTLLTDGRSPRQERMGYQDNGGEPSQHS